MVVGMCPDVQVMRERGDDVRSCGGKKLATKAQNLLQVNLRGPLNGSYKLERLPDVYRTVTQGATR